MKAYAVFGKTLNLFGKNNILLDNKEIVCYNYPCKCDDKEEYSQYVFSEKPAV